MTPPPVQTAVADLDKRGAWMGPASCNGASSSLHHELPWLLQDALAQLAIVTRRCTQLEAKLREGQVRERRQLHRAEHDDLTGLLNRAGFRDRLQQALAAGGQVVVMMLDLDGFKLINDQHGHAAGDEVLRIVAARMSHALRNGDVVSRLGGDEFACLLRDAGSPDQFLTLASKLSTSIASPLLVAGHDMSLHASLGHAASPADGACVDTLLTSADAAMYRAKRDRRARLLSVGPAPGCVPATAISQG
ncbi:MAG: GGDEF domain-containing protein [Burkholderiales bacterium]|nr:GGDEF domain-containing protein [Burkholderiales bacterium]